MGDCFLFVHYSAKSHEDGSRDNLQLHDGNQSMHSWVIRAFIMRPDCGAKLHNAFGCRCATYIRDGLGILRLDPRASGDPSEVSYRIIRGRHNRLRLISF